MYRIHQIKLPIEESKEKIPEKILKKIGMKDVFVKDWKIVKESIDARDKEHLCWVYSVDFQVASRKNPKKNLRLPSGGKLKLEIAPDMTYHGITPGSGFVSDGSHGSQSAAPRLSSRPVVVGLGPAGLFCGLILAQAGYKPIVLERGRDVEQRHIDVENFWKTGVLNPESNVQFGEGGAGTFSDGKLTTGIKDVRIRKVLEEMVAAGAPEDILYKQKPHIGTDLLRTVVKNIRQQIVSLGGEVRFETRLDGLHWQDEPCDAAVAVSAAAAGSASDPCDAQTAGDALAYCDAVLAGDGANHRRLAGITASNTASGVQAADTAEPAKPAKSAKPAKPATVETAGVQAAEIVSAGKREFIPCQVLVVAVGHSARDTFRMLDEEAVAMEQKPFSIGVRIEHPQELIDIAQYGKTSGELGLPPAEYKINYRCKDEAGDAASANLAAGRGVYTFCMCPGGHVVAASSQEGGMVVNGMSYHDRDSGVANSALLCDVRTSDFGSDYVLAGVDFQEKYERLAFEAGRVQSSEDRPEADSSRKFYSPAGTQPTAGMAYCPPKSTWSKLRDGNAPELEGCLPDFAVAAFREAMPNLGKKLRGFDRDDAIVTGVETRSSSPVRMLRDGTCESVNSKGLYPCGEGAGYAGGITSAAVDGIRVAESIISGWLPAE